MEKTMYSIKQITQEVREILENKVRQKLPIDPRNITIEILDDHEGDDFVMCAAYQGLRNLVRNEVNKLAGDNYETNEQIKLPGYEHLHAYYVVDVGDRVGMALPVESMSRDELLAKAVRYRKYGDACHTHADEIMRFLESRDA